MDYTWIFAFTIFFMCDSVLNQDDYSFLNNLCIQQSSCGSCVSTSYECFWCSDLNFKSDIRCNTKDRLLAAGCPEASLGLSKKSYREYISNLAFTDVELENQNQIIQIIPQREKIGLSPLNSQTVQFTYRPAKNFALDLYFLMDMTWSMRDDKETILGLRKDLQPFLKNLTNNFMLGFGSFVDKPLMPYISTSEKAKKNPCTYSEANAECEPTYDFRHRLSMSDDVERFLDTVRDTGISGNLDNAEGGLDALMQVLVCGDSIGWRPNSRKIVLFATNGILHYAGDGVLGGVTKPNDKQCHMNENGEYMSAKEMDYPSLEQIYRVMLEKKVSLIFAVTKDVRDYYENIKEIFPEYVFVTTLSDDSSNILNVVKQGYESFVKTIKFEDDSDEDVDLTYFTKCGVKNRPFIEIPKCDDITIGDRYIFSVNLTMNKCPIGRENYTKIITISETQLGQDNLTLEVELLCECDCGKYDDENLMQCPKNSKLQCGKCECSEGWSGNNCDCNVNQEGALAPSDRCRKPGDVMLCSGVGDCLCDTCHCDKGFDGKYCECQECPVSREYNEICGGKSRGRCACGECVCNEFWFGATCSCSKNICTAPWNVVPCSGRGTCTCGGCVCWTKNDTELYTGKYCETCPDCENPACFVYEDCVKCIVTGNCTADSCIFKNGDIRYKMETKAYESNGDSSFCVLRMIEDDVTCQIKYTYENDIRHYLSQNIIIYPKECDFALRAGTGFAMLFGLLLLILLIGVIAICIIKLRIRRQEELEYKKHEQAAMVQMANWSSTNQNPLYKSPVKQYVVPDDFKKRIVEDEE